MYLKKKNRNYRSIYFAFLLGAITPFLKLKNIPRLVMPQVYHLK